MRSMLLAIVVLTVGCTSSAESDDRDVPELPSRSPRAVEAAESAPAPAATEKPAAPTTKSAPLGPFCPSNTGHGECFDFDDGKPFGQALYNPPGKPNGSCAAVETQALSGSRSLLCSDAGAAFGVAQGAKLDLKVDVNVLVDAGTQPETRFSVADIFIARGQKLQPQVDFVVTYDKASPQGRIDFVIKEEDPAKGVLVATAFPTKLTGSGWHRFSLHVRKAGAPGAIAVTAKAEDVVVFDGQLRNGYADATAFAGVLGSDAGWDATNGSAPVFLDNVLIN